MTRAWVALAVFAAVWALPERSAACPAESETVLFHSCWGDARVRLVLLPESVPLEAADGAAELVVTGAYTGTDKRASGHPNPVGLFLWQGEAINRNLGRMDGILVIDADGRPALYHRARVPLGEERYDLSMLDQRSRFIREIEARNASVMQSHLLVVDGEPDVTAREDAPSHRRRLMFTDAHGFGIWQSALPVTLHQAAGAIETELAPDMALNLDMGSFDYCARRPREGTPEPCGSLTDIANPKLSNLLVLTLR